jgi:CubicO group peptidase (beta-lactamase class C family)
LTISALLNFFIPINYQTLQQPSTCRSLIKIIAPMTGIHLTVIRKYFAIIVLIAVSGLASAQQKQPMSLQQLKDSVQAIVTAEHIPGMMLGLVKNDSVLFAGGFGYADVKAKRPVTAATLFRMGSITKMFVALAVLKLAKQGKLQLNDELKKIAPEISFTNPWETQHPVRIVQLLEHTAGFDDMKLNRMCSQDQQSFTSRQLVEFQQHSLVCRWPPGERHAYSNPGYVILGYLIEKLSGSSYDQYITDSILQPLGMHHSNFNLRSALPQTETRQYVVHNGSIIETPVVNILMPPAGALWSCSNDMVQWLRIFLNNGRPLFADSIISEMETMQSSLAARAGLTDGYALGNSNLLLYKQYGWRGHGGLMGTCFSSFAYNRTLGAGFVVSSNGNQPNSRIDKLVADFLEQGAVLKKTVSIPIDAAAILPFLGQYQFVNPRNEIAGFKDKLLNTPELVLENGKLFVQWFTGEKNQLLQTAPEIFAHEAANASTIVFTKNENGVRVMIMDGEFFEQTNTLKVQVKRWLTITTVLLAITAAIAGFFSLPGLLLGKIPRNRIWVRLIPMLALAGLSWAVINLLAVQEESYLLSELTTINKRTLIIFGGTMLFGMLAVLHLAMVLRVIKQFNNKMAAIYWLLAALSCCYIAFVLWQNGWIGLRAWAM